LLIDDTDKKLLTEAEIRSRYITPAIREIAGWNWVQIGEEITLGKIIVRGKAVARARNFNLDIKNPHREEETLGNPVKLLATYENRLAEIARLQEELKRALEEALTHE